MYLTIADQIFIGYYLQSFLQNYKIQIVLIHPTPKNYEILYMPYKNKGSWPGVLRERPKFGGRFKGQFGHFGLVWESKFSKKGCFVCKKKGDSGFLGVAKASFGKYGLGLQVLRHVL